MVTDMTLKIQPIKYVLVLEAPVLTAHRQTASKPSKDEKGLQMKKEKKNNYLGH